jgi:UDP-GlcNAc:undecaprenyl-phosphate GlcNAc-1-phosphate transferase
MTISLLTAFLIPAVLTYVITPQVIQIAKKFRLTDDPRRRYHPAHVHTGIIPRAGGLALFLGLSTGIISGIGLTKISTGILFSAFILTFVGIMDDVKDVNPYIRVITNTIAALIVVACGIGIPYITNPFSEGIIRLDFWKITIDIFGQHSILILADLFALIWILWTINIVGWSAGVDGQMPGFVAISAIVLGILSLRFPAESLLFPKVPELAAIVAGTYLGFLPWNFFPQKIMPGYSGKTLAGLFLAILGILSFGKVGTAILVLGVPTLDALFTLVRRIISGHSLVQADRGHLHHLLIDFGWSKRKIALFYWLISAILGGVALSITSRQKVYAFILIGVLFGGFVLWLRYFTQFSKQPDQDNG